MNNEKYKQLEQLFWEWCTEQNWYQYAVYRGTIKETLNLIINKFESNDARRKLK